MARRKRKDFPTWDQLTDEQKIAVDRLFRYLHQMKRRDAA